MQVWCQVQNLTGSAARASGRGVATTLQVPGATTVAVIGELPEDRAISTGRATNELAARNQRQVRGWADRTEAERAREVVAHSLYCAGLSTVQIARVMAAGVAEVRLALGYRPNAAPSDQSPLCARHARHVDAWARVEPAGACTTGEARTAVRRMLAVVEHGRDGRQWHARRDQHVAELHEIKEIARDSGNMDGALKALGAIARIEGFDAPQRSINVHGHALVGPNTSTTLPDGPGVVAGISVAVLRAMPRAERAALVSLIGAAEVARAELPPGHGDDELIEGVADAEIVDDEHR